MNNRCWDSKDKSQQIYRFIFLFRIRTMDPGATYSEQELREAEEFMRRTPLTERTSGDLMAKFKMTRNTRRQRISSHKHSAEEIIKMYRLLSVSKDAVSYTTNILVKI